MESTTIDDATMDALRGIAGSATLKGLRLDPAQCDGSGREINGGRVYTFENDRGQHVVVPGSRVDAHLAAAAPQARKPPAK